MAKKFVLAAFLAFAVIIAPARAQAPAPASAPTAAVETDATPTLPDLSGVIVIDKDTHKVTVDVGLFGSQIIAWLVTTFGGVISLAVSAWIFTLVQKMRIQATDKLRERFQQIILSGLSIGAARAEQALQAGSTKVEIKNEAAITAVQYVQEHGAETAKKLGLDVMSSQAVDVVKANIEKMVNDPTVATPPSISPEKPTPVVIAPAAPSPTPGATS